MNAEFDADVISDAQLRQLLHPSESSRFYLALFAALPIAVLGLLLIFASVGVALVIVAYIFGIVWIGVQIFKANLVGSSTRVSPDNFPEIYDVLVEAKRRLSFDKPIDVYIVKEGSVNASLYKFFSTDFIVLNSEVVSSMPIENCREQMLWVIGRFIGALKAKHMRFSPLAVIVSSVQKLVFLNLLLLPYERATQYSGDQIGFALCNELSEPIFAFDKLLVGKDLAKSVQIKGLLSQAGELQTSFFGWLARIFSSHPHMTDRYINLISFARYMNPDKFEVYMRQFDDVTSAEIGTLLARHYPLRAN